MKTFLPSRIGKYDDSASDDLYDCLQFNRLNTIKLNDLSKFVAEICGENDEYDWWWILEMRDSKYALISAGCDYTGWDCGTWISHESVHDTLLEAVKASPKVEEHSNRHIRDTLSDQVIGVLPFGIYKESNPSTK